jgi:hypothetical protein
MLKKIALVFSFFLIFSCTEKKATTIPETILPIEKMANVLLDVHLLEAAMNVAVYNTDKKPGEEATPGFDILKKNNITKQQYTESFDFYSNHPEMLNTIYDMVLNNLSKMQAEVSNKK